MVQIAAEDTYDDYVICRGFDPRILRFVDYAEGDANKPGISVAKPFGKRTAGTYQVAEVYPAFLPTQGNANFQDFRQVTYVPPSPVAVEWRVGQNPGVVVGGLDGGQPEELADEIEILYDHNGKAINWLLIDSKGSSDGWIKVPLVSIRTASSGTPADAPWTGLIIATVTVEETSPGLHYLINQDVDMVDKQECVYDHAEEDLVGVWTWGKRAIAKSLDPAAAPGTLTPLYWAADDRCCVAADTGA